MLARYEKVFTIVMLLLLYSKIYVILYTTLIYLRKRYRNQVSLGEATKTILHMLLLVASNSV